MFILYFVAKATPKVVNNTISDCILRRKDIERGKGNQYKLIYNPNYDFVGKTK